MNTAVYKKIIPQDVINKIIKFYDNEPAVYSESGIINKNLEYHVPENFAYITLKHFMDIVVGSDHEFSTGSYKASNNPYIVHVDSKLQFEQYKCMMFDNGVTKCNKAVLIPLVEGPEFRTITFKNHSDYNPTIQQIQAARSKKNNLVKEDFSHEPKFDDLNYVEVDTDYQWELGDVLVWNRNQWHISSNFSKFNKTKTFLVLFMA